MNIPQPTAACRSSVSWPNKNIKQLKGDICGEGDPTSDEANDDQGEEDEDDDREWKPEACFTAVDLEYGGKVVDLTRNITRGPIEKIPGEERMWRVPHYVQVCCCSCGGCQERGKVG